MSKLGCCCMDTRLWLSQIGAQAVFQQEACNLMSHIETECVSRLVRFFWFSTFKLYRQSEIVVMNEQCQETTLMAGQSRDVFLEQKAH